MNLTIHKQIIDLLEDAGMVGMTLNVSAEHKYMVLGSGLTIFHNRNSQQLSVDSINELSNFF
jgi:hypothetical protein